MPIIVIFKAMGIQSEQEILQMIGSEDIVMAAMIPCFEECHQQQVFTQSQVLQSILLIIILYIIIFLRSYSRMIHFIFIVYRVVIVWLLFPAL